VTRRPKAVNTAYNQGDSVLRFEIVPHEDHEALLMTVRELKLDGKIVAVRLNEHELTVTISKLFECLTNLQARRQ
jgi:hypothetical protein